MLNVADFGAVPDAQIVSGALTGTDNTVAIQAGINAAAGDTLVFGKGSYRCGALNVTNRAPIRLQGSGPAYGGTRFLPDTDGIFLNCAGTPAVQLDSFMIGDRFNPRIPSVAILHAVTPQSPGADFVHHSNLMVTGRYSASPLCVWGVGTSMAEKCAYWNFYEGGEAFSGAFMFENYFQLESPFCEFVSGGAGCWTFTNSEFHDFQTQGPYLKLPLLLRGTFDTQFIGGVISGSNRLMRTNDPTGQNPPRRLVFMGVRFENEGGTPQPAHVIDLVSNLESSSFIRCMQGQSGTFSSGNGNLVNCSVD